MFTPRKYPDDEVRRAFREAGHFPRRWTIPDEDLEAYLGAEYENSDDSESAESCDGHEVDPPLTIRDRTTYGTFDDNGSLRQQLIHEFRIVLQQPRRRRGRLSLSSLAELRCASIVCIVLGLVLLGTIYLGFPTLKAFLFPG